MPNKLVIFKITSNKTGKFFIGHKEMESSSMLAPILKQEFVDGTYNKAIPIEEFRGQEGFEAEVLVTVMFSANYPYHRLAHYMGQWITQHQFKPLFLGSTIEQVVKLQEEEHSNAKRGYAKKKEKA